MTPVKGKPMDEQERSIEQLQHAIADAKRLKAELDQRVADLNKLIKKAQSVKEKIRKPKMSN